MSLRPPSLPLPICPQFLPPHQGPSSDQGVETALVLPPSCHRGPRSCKLPPPLTSRPTMASRDPLRPPVAHPPGEEKPGSQWGWMLGASCGRGNRGSSRGGGGRPFPAAR